MFKRLAAGAVALIVAGLAIGLPIVLTEAGNSRSSSSGTTLNGAFSFADSGGDRYFAYVYASDGKSSYKEAGNDGNQGGGSQRAKSGSQRAQSQRPKANDDNTFAYRDVHVYIDHYDSQGNWIEFIDAFGDPDTLTIANDLSTGEVVALLEADVYDSEYNHQRRTMLQIDLDFLATGPLSTSRDRFTDHVKSPRQRFSYMFTDSRRDADASGSIVLDGLNIAAGGSDYAEIATFSSRSSFQY